MYKYERINYLLEEIENLLDGFILSGTGVIRGGTESELKKLQEICRKIGLHFGGTLLQEMEKALSMKRHDLKGEDSNVVDCCCRLGAYVSAVRSKLRLNIVEENMEALES